MKRRRVERGFTIIELNIALIFVAILIIAAATTIIATTRLYQQGVALKEINQVGRETVDIVRRDVARAKVDAIQVDQSDGVHRVCLGNVSYIIVDAARLNATNTAGLPTLPESGEIAHMVRVDDTAGIWCQKSDGVFTVTAITDVMNPVELLRTDTVNTVAVHDISMRTVAKNTVVSGEALVEFTMLIGTNEAETVADGRCRPPTDRRANFNNCAVREFSTVFRVTGVQ